MFWVKGTGAWRSLPRVAFLFQCGALSAWGQAGALDLTYLPKPSYIVSALAVQPDGKALLGGAFSTVDGFERRALARLNANGTVDTNFVPATIDGDVRDIILQPDGKILVGGQFARVGGVFGNNVARLESNGSVDPSFNSAVTSFSYYRGMALQSDGKLLVICDDLERLLPDGGADTNFQRLLAYQWITNGDSATSANNSFRCVTELGDGTILVGGWIMALTGQAVNAGLIRLNPDGTWDTSFSTLTNESVSAMLVQPDGRIMVGRNGRLARLNGDGMLDITFTPANIEGDVMALARQADGKILVGGYFQRVAGVLRLGIARFNVDGTLDRNFDAGDVSGYLVTSVAVQPDAKIVIGGYFTSVNGQNRPYVARLMSDNASYPGRFEFLSVSNAVAEAAGSLLIPIRRYGGSSGTVSVVVTADGWGSASPGSDYAPRTETLVFLPDQTSNVLTVTIMNDALVEGPYAWEAFNVQLSAPTGGATLGSESRAIGYILEDDTAIAFASTYGVNAEEAAGQAVIELVRLGVTNTAVGVSFETANGTATAPADFTAQSGAVSFAAGETNKTITVVLDDDVFVEGDETFSIRLSAPTGGASLASNSNVTVRIIDDVSFMAFDESATMTPTVATEPDGHAMLKVRRWGRTNNMVSLSFATSNTTALAGSDYRASSGTLTLLPGETEGVITVPILDDAEVEEAEQFQVTLSAPTGTLVLPYGTLATVSLISDDGAGYPDTSFRPVVPGERVNQFALAPGGKIVVRGDSVITNGEMRATLVRLNSDGSVDPTFQPDLADDAYWISTSADGKVYVCSGRGIKTAIRRLLPTGETDRSFDPFFVDYLAWPGALVHAMVVQADGKVVISAQPAGYYSYEPTTNVLNRLNVDGTYDLDFGPVFQIGTERLLSPPDALALQPNGKILLAAQLTGANGSSKVRVVRLTAAGHVDTAFSPPEITGFVRGIRVLDNKILIYGRFTAVNGTPRQGVAILEVTGAVDPTFAAPFQPFNSFENGIVAAVVQGDGKVIFSGSVRMTGGGRLSLGRLHIDGSPDVSFHGADYSGIYVFDLALQADGKVLTGGSIGPFFGAGLERLNNDPRAGAGFLEFVSASRTVDETNSQITVTVRRGGGTNGSVRVPYATISGTASNETDFLSQSGILAFTAGELGEKTITIPILDDTLPEGDEAFLVSLGPPLGGATWGANGANAITIRENDTMIQFPETQAYVRENAAAKIVNVRRLGRSTGGVSIAYSTSDASARAGVDYVAQAGRLNFGDGETNQQIALTILDDRLSESNETFVLTLSAPSPGVMLGTNASAEVTIVDNDRPGTLDESFDPGIGICEQRVWPGSIRAIAVQPDGRILVGGDFYSFDGVPCPGLVRLLPGGAVDHSFVATFPFPAFGMVTRLMLQPNGKVLVVLGQDSLVRLEADGSPDMAFGFAAAGDPDTGEPGWIEALVLQTDGGILVAGRFDRLKGVARTNLARLNSDGSMGAALATRLSAGAESGWIRASAIDAVGRLLIGGVFDKVNGLTRHNLARLDTNGVLDLGFVAPPFTDIAGGDLDVDLRNIILQPNGKLVVSILRRQPNGDVLSDLVRLNPDASRDSGFNVVISNRFYAELPLATVLRQPDGRFLIAGQFTHVNGVARRNIARLNSNGSLDLTFQSGEIDVDPDYFQGSIQVYAMAIQANGQLLIGGKLSELDRQMRCGIARLNGVGLQVRAMNRNSNQQWRILFTGTAGAHYSVLTSSNLTEWAVIGSAVETAPGKFEFIDPDSSLRPRRFYRLRLP